MASPGQPSLMLLEELLATQDPSFLQRIKDTRDGKTLVAIARKWGRDRRPWAREQLLAYLDAPLVQPRHQPLVKHLFKDAEEQHDHEMMGAFLVAFDRLVRRRRRKRYHWDFQFRQGWQEEVLVAPANGNPGAQRVGSPGKDTYVDTRNDLTPGPLFSNPTRNYLRRRTWRYFRRMGFAGSVDYAPSIIGALRRYRDADFEEGENILDCWGMMHACFFDSPAIEFTPSHANLAEGHALSELSAAPQFVNLWRAERVGNLLLELLLSARSRLVRVWSIQMLRAHHQAVLARADAELVLRLLDHADEEMQTFGAELLEKLQGLETLPIATWLTMLKTRNLGALGTIVGIMRRHVSADRLNLTQLVELTTSKPTPVARLGLDLLKMRRLRLPRDAELIAGLAAARCQSVAGEIAGFALSQLGQAEVYQVDWVVRFFDSLMEELREAAWEWLKPGTPGYDDPTLWSRLLETPDDRTRLNIVAALEARSAIPGAGPADLTPLWTSVLLNIQRGGRHKIKALRQISEALVAKPEHAEALIPILAIAIRSVRPAEGRFGLAAIVTSLEARPELEPVLMRSLPELRVSPREAC